MVLLICINCLTFMSLCLDLFRTEFMPNHLLCLLRSQNRIRSPLDSLSICLLGIWNSVWFGLGMYSFPWFYLFQGWSNHEKKVFNVIGWPMYYCELIIGTVLLPWFLFHWDVRNPRWPPKLGKKEDEFFYFIFHRVVNNKTSIFCCG
jgi:hypothetical protein